jgi:hypothetical protein
VINPSPSAGAQAGSRNSVRRSPDQSPC